ncbi:MAG: glycosyltransferase [Methanothrix sp.]|nr:glycosyltransferase [Methanothrix sp.]
MDGSESLKFSIITASYNKKEFIESCIGSVLGQTLPDIEYIIIYGRSTDGAMDVFPASPLISKETTPLLFLSRVKPALSVLKQAQTL